ncbi:unnamed protein product [Amoebophrya sp. A120]|nr:unnamed protein product [Amoebophrya sp. A120]|eukprot:GSA120T00021385001.1
MAPALLDCGRSISPLSSTPKRGGRTSASTGVTPKNTQTYPKTTFRTNTTQYNCNKNGTKKSLSETTSSAHKSGGSTPSSSTHSRNFLAKVALYCATSSFSGLGFLSPALDPYSSSLSTRNYHTGGVGGVTALTVAKTKLQVVGDGHEHDPEREDDPPLARSTTVRSGASGFSLLNFFQGIAGRASSSSSSSTWTATTTGTATSSTPRVEANNSSEEQLQPQQGGRGERHEHQLRGVGHFPGVEHRRDEDSSSEEYNTSVEQHESQDRRAGGARLPRSDQATRVRGGATSSSSNNDQGGHDEEGSEGSEQSSGESGEEDRNSSDEQDNQMTSNSLMSVNPFGNVRMPMSAVVGPRLLKKVDHDKFPQKSVYVDTEEELKDADCVVLYFSAHWCPPCRQFTPRLIEKHLRAHLLRKSVKFVFASLDNSQADWNEYYGLMPWLALDFPTSQQRTKVLMQQLGLRGVPSVVLYWKNGKIDVNGRELITQPDFLQSVKMIGAAGGASSSAFLAQSTDSVASGHTTSTVLSPVIQTSTRSRISQLAQTEQIDAEVIFTDPKAIGEELGESISEPFSIEVDPSQTEEEALTTFRYQLFSLTNIEPEQQRVFFDGIAAEGAASTSCTVDPGLSDFFAILDQLKEAQHQGRKVKVYVLGNFSGSEDDPFQFAGKVVDPDLQTKQQMQAMLQAKAGALNLAPHKWSRVFGDATKVRGYEDREMQTACLLQIPIPKLYETALERAKSGTMAFDQAFLDVLVKWFKHEFFSWPAAKPKSIHVENGVCSGVGGCRSNEAEAIFASHNTELYRCDTTGKEQRFPRYNNVFKLLQTRLGRCGEWANCFAAMLRAVGFETRYIVDFTDHVWNEVWLKSREEWIHVDSCEATIDAPLLYEQGWGKNLEYLFAYARDHCEDVSRRYTKKGLPALTRNFFADENEVKRLFTVVRSHCEDEDLASLDGGDDVKNKRRAFLDKRRTGEQKLLENCFEKYNAGEIDAKNLNARESGDQAWRRGRGELGKTNFGGSHADTKTFADEEQEKEVAKVIIWDGQFCHGLQLIYRDVPSSKHPPRWNGDAADCKRKEITLAPGERIVKVCGGAGAIVDRLEIHTSAGQQISAGASTGGEKFCFEGKDICGLYGGFGGHVHNIGVVYRKEQEKEAAQTTTSTVDTTSASSASSTSATEKETFTSGASKNDGGAAACASTATCTSGTAATGGTVIPPTNTSSTSTSGQDGDMVTTCTPDGVCTRGAVRKEATATSAAASFAPPARPTSGGPSPEQRQQIKDEIKRLFNYYISEAGGKMENPEAAARAFREVSAKKPAA